MQRIAAGRDPFRFPNDFNDPGVEHCKNCHAEISLVRVFFELHLPHRPHLPHPPHLSHLSHLPHLPHLPHPPHPAHPAHLAHSSHPPQLSHLSHLPHPRRFVLTNPDWYYSTRCHQSCMCV